MMMETNMVGMGGGNWVKIKWRQREIEGIRWQSRGLIYSRKFHLKSEVATDGQLNVPAERLTEWQCLTEQLEWANDQG